MNQKSVNISLRLDTSTYNVIQALATKNQSNLSQIIRKHLKSDLKRLGLLEDEPTIKAPETNPELRLPDGWEE